MNVTTFLLGLRRAGGEQKKEIAIDGGYLLGRTHAEEREVAEFLAPAPPGQFTSLCPDVCEQILMYLGVGHREDGSSSLGLVSRAWREYVLYCPLWEGVFKKRYPFSYKVYVGSHSTEDAVAWSSEMAEVAKHNKKRCVSKLSKRESTSTSKSGGISGFFSNLFKSTGSRLFRGGNVERQILMVGLDAAGKTTMLYKLKPGEVDTAIPTIGGFCVETAKFKNITFNCWDVGGGSKIRPLWRHYYDATGAVMFVVDSNDRGRISQAKEELQRLMCEEQLTGVKILVLANKQDLPGAMSVEEVGLALGLDEARGVCWCIQGTIAVSGEGLYEGLDWLATQLQKE